MAQSASAQKEIRVAGFGGQGVILAGFILGKAASLYDRRAATMTQAYGPESRGGAASADVVLGDQEIGYPKVKHPDVLLAMSQEAFTLNVTTVGENGTVIIDEDLVKAGPANDPRIRAIPATRLAEELGKKVVANIIMLGYCTGLTGLISEQAMRRAIQGSVPSRFLALNLRAFELGLEQARAARP